MFQKKLVFVVCCLYSYFFWLSDAKALPAFAFREGQTTCTLCHTNNAVPHLTKEGYMYRRAGFRFPSDIGNEESETKNVNLLHHLAAGINIDYLFTKNKFPAQDESITNNNITVREVEIWPLVGAFYGHYGTWSELNMTPNTAADRSAPTPPSLTTSPNGEVSLEQADLRYVTGNANLFYNFRIGLIAPEGYGASDQWIDDGNLPLIDQLSAYYNQDTLVLPLGAFQSPQMGAEFGMNWPDTYLTFGIYNGFDGTNGFANHLQSTPVPRLTSAEGRFSHDYKVQIEQFFNDRFVVTGVYYWGTIPLLDPMNSVVWQDRFWTGRLYLSYSVAPNLFDLFFGSAYGSHEFVNPGTIDRQGQFSHSGAFIGANWYLNSHITFATHLDHYQYAREKAPSAKGGSFMMNVSLEPKSIWVFHYSVYDADLNSEALSAGRTSDFRAEWRFLF
ncbi:MAG: hypothetical protein ACXVCY_07575 [Pseudobdellovibrionaceae bacterium]